MDRVIGSWKTQVAPGASGWKSLLSQKDRGAPFQRRAEDNSGRVTQF